MPLDATTADLTEVPVEKIDHNPENPRIYFRAAELETLLNSIRRHGVQVPISVYKERGRFVIIDGERRWRCCLKLNKKTIPALVQAKPNALGNLLLMFNIHALREQWDLLTIALKLPRVIDLLRDRNSKEPTEKELADETGLPRAVIRRCRLLMEMPQEYRDQLVADLQRPKNQQQLSEDFFIELEKALKTVERALPSALIDKNRARDVLIAKYKTKVIGNLVDLRLIPKIARATKNVSTDEGQAVQTLQRLFVPNKYSPKEAFEESVSVAYSERELTNRLESIVERLEGLPVDGLDSDFRTSLKQMLRRLIAVLDKLT